MGTVPETRLYSTPPGYTGPSPTPSLKPRLPLLRYLSGVTGQPQGWKSSPCGTLRSKVPGCHARSQDVTMKARRFLLSGARGKGEAPRPHPCRARRSPGEGSGDRGDQVSEAAGHLSPSLEARRPAGTAQGRAAPWRLNSGAEARGAGGCGVWLL